MSSQSSPIHFVPHGSIIIPKNKFTNKFNRTVYIPTMTENKITSEEVNQVLSDLELITKKLPTTCGNWMTIVHIFVLPLIAMWTLAEKWWTCSGYYGYETGFSQRNWKGRWMPFFIYFLLTFIYFKASKKYQLIKVKSQAETLLQIHQPQFNKKGYRLSIAFNFPEWIEIQNNDYPHQMSVPNANQNNIPQSFSQVLQSSPVKKMRKYGASALQSLALTIQNNPNSQNNQDYQPPLQSEQVNNQC